VLTCTTDVLRLKVPAVMGVLESIGARRIMRAHETTQLTGGFYMGLGVAATMSISPPSISTAALLFLVLGDMSAAIIGVSFGGEVASVKLGRTGKKSLEGSLAMLVVCFVVGCVLFATVEVRAAANTAKNRANASKRYRGRPTAEPKARTHVRRRPHVHAHVHAHVHVCACVRVCVCVRTCVRSSGVDVGLGLGVRALIRV